MPATLFERIVAALMLVTTLTLAVLVLREVREEEAQTRASAVQEGTIPPVQTTVSAPPGTNPTEPTTTTREDTTDPTPTAGEGATTTESEPNSGGRLVTRLVLTATNDTWLDARARSAQGRVLYAGFLDQGQSLNLRANGIWVRFGSASNLAAQLNGQPLPLEPGTYSALITPRGLQFLGA